MSRSLLTAVLLAAACSGPTRPPPPPLSPAQFTQPAQDTTGSASGTSVPREFLDYATRWPNPRAKLALEEAPLENGNALEDADVIVGISQSIPRSGRIESATRAEQAEATARERELEALTLDVRRAVRGAFAGALYAQEVVQLRTSLLDVAERRVELVQHRVAAGDEVEDAMLRVELEAVTAQHEFERADTNLGQALVALTKAVGNPHLDFGHLEGDFSSAFELPELEELLSRLESNPTLLAASAGSAAARARFDLARDLASPDLDLGLFYRRTGAGTNALDLGISMPIAVFDRGQGRITEARAGILDAQSRERSARLSLDTGLRGAWQRAQAAWRHLELLETEVLPRAEQLAERSELRYGAGDVSLDELLRRRAQWTGVQLGHLETLHETMLAWAELTAFLAEAP